MNCRAVANECFSVFVNIISDGAVSGRDGRMMISSINGVINIWLAVINVYI